MSGLLDDQTVHALQSSSVAQSLGGAFYGVYFTLTILSSYVLICQGTHKLSCRCLLLAIILMFVCDTGSLAVEIISERYQIESLGPPPYESAEGLTRLAVAVIVLARINYLLSDAIVLWRAWILFKGRIIFFRSLLIFCLICSFAAVFVDGAFTYMEAKSEDGEGGVPVKTRVILPAVLLATNVIVTSFFALRAWEVRQFVNRSTQVVWILMLFLESGIIYCAIWLTALIALASRRFSADQANLFGTVIPHLTGIYPTFIVLLVFLDKKDRASQEDNNFVSASLRFSSMPPGGDHFSLVQRVSRSN